MRFKKFLFAAAIILISQAALAEELSYEGGSELGAWVMPEATKAFEAKAGIKFKGITYKLGSGKGCEAAIEGRIPLAGVSRALTSEERDKKPYYQVVGYDAIVIYVNDKNPIANISKRQLKAIYKGGLTNWKELGGKDAQVIPVTESLTGKGATLKTFQDIVLEGTDFGPVKEVDRSHDCAAYVVTDENAIGYASIAFQQPGIKPIALDGIEPSSKNVQSGMYRLSRPLLLVTKNVPRGNLKKFFDFILSREGQKIVGEKFIPIK